MNLNDFDFILPKHLIAQYPLTERSASKLLCVDHSNQFKHQHFHQLLNLVEEGDLLIFNNTKVLPARIFGKKTSGGKVEVFLERVLDTKRVLAQLRVSKAPRVGDKLFFSPDYCLVVLGRQNQFYELMLIDHVSSILEMMNEIGKIPLPPYMNRQPDDNDRERYQTVYAKHLGSVAAPTAGFHFDQVLLQQLRDKGIEMAELTLHIGAGTFLPVRVESIQDHHMHAEYIEVSPSICEAIVACRARGKRVIAVGTTSLRALESASLSGITQPYQGDTTIFIYPGFKFQCVDVLVTNLHLPCSTLLMLVSAFGGYEKIMEAYKEAVNQSYRFYSYGDAMWIERCKNN